LKLANFARPDSAPGFFVLRAARRTGIATIHNRGSLYPNCIINTKWRCGGRIGTDAAPRRDKSAGLQFGWRSVRAPR